MRILPALLLGLLWFVPGGPPAALAQAAAEAPAAAALAPADRDTIAAALGAQIAGCTNIIAIPFPARRMTIEIEMKLDPRGRPVPGSLRLDSYADGDAAYAGIAFTQLRNAIIECGADGFDIPAGTHADWGHMIVAFPLPAIAAPIGETY